MGPVWDYHLPVLHTFILRALLVLGIAANVAFLLINLHPERPHLATRKHLKLLLRADLPRAAWIKENQLDLFAAQHDVDIEVVTAASFEEVISALQKERDHPSGLALASANDVIADELQKAGAIRPFHEVVPRATLAGAMEDYLPEAVSRCLGPDGRAVYLPRRAEMDIAAYRYSAVEDAYLHWTADRAAIQAALAEANGIGLPRGQ